MGAGVSSYPDMGVIDMAHTGAPPKNIKHGRGGNADWTDVPDIRYDGPWTIDLPRKCGRRNWLDQVTAWWDEVKRMPHCVLWTATDWHFALETAYMKQMFWLDYQDGEMKSTAATEIRRREDQIGTTSEARRKLRIRYIDPETAALEPGTAEAEDDDTAGEQAEPGKVTSLASRRNRLTA
jgi:hypothetical protein